MSMDGTRKLSQLHPPLAAAWSRRALLQTGLIASAALPAQAAIPTGAGNAKAPFLLSPDIRYFNAANIGPAFRVVVEAQIEGTKQFQSNPSREYREKYIEGAVRVRARLAKRLNVTSDEIAVLRNASEANTVAVLGLDLRPGDEVIVTEHNHQSILDTWKLRASREGFTVKVLPTPVEASSPQVIIDAFAAATGPKTRAIFIPHITNVTGLIYPVAEIAEIARKSQAWLHVDGAQSFGWMQLDLRKLGCDSYSGSTHKWLMGPLESGMLYVRGAVMDRLHPTMLSHGYWLADARDMKTAQRYEILGQRDDPKLDAIEATLDQLDRIGEAAIEARVRANATLLRQTLSTVPAARFVGSPHPALGGPVMTYAFAGKDVAAIRKFLWAEGKVATAAANAHGMQLIRFSPHIYNDADEMQALAGLLRRA